MITNIIGFFLQTIESTLRENSGCVKSFVASLVSSLSEPKFLIFLFGAFDCIPESQDRQFSSFGKMGNFPFGCAFGCCRNWEQVTLKCIRLATGLLILCTSQTQRYISLYIGQTIKGRLAFTC